jgi:beta-glucanase (GH16 family)
LVWFAPAVVGLFGCGGTATSSPQGTKDDAAALSAGGSGGTGGNALGTGGTTSGSGGVTGTGGSATSAGGTTSGSGSVTSTGGGATGTGGTTSGLGSVTVTGGTSSSGGATLATGGRTTVTGGSTTGTGGNTTGSGGSMATGGRSGSGGTAASGGTSGGSVGSGGNAGKGGLDAGTAGSGGNAGTAGSSRDGSVDAATGGAGGTIDAGSGGPERCTSRAAIDGTKWTLVWSDEFDKDGAPDSSNWGYEKGFVRNSELQWYQPDNATVSGGLLTIAAQKQQVLNPNYKAGSTDWKQNRQYAQYTSTSMTTSGKKSFLYGRFELCGQIDTRQGSWPAFWILGNGLSWPASGEVDIMEYYANGVRSNICKPSGGNCDWLGSVSQSLSSLGGTTWSSKFHLWAMEWDSQKINLYLDDKLVYSYTITSTNPYTGNAFYMLVNLAIGGQNGGDPSGTTFPITYLVDYVRVYQMP